LAVGAFQPTRTRHSLRERPQNCAASS
jgi:hypothetical protein